VNVGFPAIADICLTRHARNMKSNRKVWTAVYVAAAVMFFGGYLARIYESAYFPIFVGFCILFGLAVNIYWWRTHKMVRRD